MRACPLVLAVALVACKTPSKPPPSEAGGGADASVATSPDAGSPFFATAPARPLDAGEPVRPPPFPKVSGDLQLVAVGGSVLWLERIGERVWLSGRGLDAYADGDGPLVKAPDLLKGLPYDGKKHKIQIAGLSPHLYALRSRTDWTREETPEAAAFALRDGKWVKAPALASDQVPLAFLPWGEGALIVWSKVEFDTPHWISGEIGTNAQYIDPDGHVSDAKLGLDPRFVAFDADGDGTNLSLLATRGGDRRPGDEHERGVYVLRGTKDEGMAAAVPLVDVSVGYTPTFARIVETGSSAYVVPPFNVQPWSSPNLAYVVGADGAPRPRAIAIGCHDVVQSILGDGTIYAITSDACHPGHAGHRALIRVAGDGHVEEIELPRFVKGPSSYRVATAEEQSAIPCEPTRILHRAPTDVWVTLDCTTDREGADRSAPRLSAVLRRSHAQPPIVLP